MRFRYFIFLLFFIFFQINRNVAQDPLRILPLGNSLTYGYINGTEPEGNRISYRYRLYNLLTAAGYDFTFKGHISSGYNIMPADCSKNGGISGIRAYQLADVLESGYYYDTNQGKYVDIVLPHASYLSVPEHQPDLILLQIGSNDVYHGNNSPAAVTDILDAIDQYETTYSTEVLVIVAKILSTKHSSGSCTANANVTAYNNALQTLIMGRTGDKVKLIDLQCGADINYNTNMTDLLHPTQDGYNLMGDAWFEAINTIHSAPVVSTITVSPVNEGNSFSTINLDSYVTDDYTTDQNITWTLSAVPEHLNVTINSNRTVTVTPIDPDWFGSESVTFVATDKGYYIEKLKKSTSRSVNFTVNNVNDPPVILSQLRSINIQEDQNFQISLSDLSVQDIDNNSNELSLNLLPGSNYTIVGNEIYPDENFSGILNVNVSASDLLSTGPVFQVSVSVSGVNDAPDIIGNDAVSLKENTPLEITLDHLEIFDPDNGIEDISLYVLGGNNYTVTGHTITPNVNFEGTLNVNLRVRDLELLSDIYIMHVLVTAFNNPPVFETQMGDTSIYINQQFLYGSTAYDPNNDPVTYIRLSIPDFLTFVTSTGVLIGTPSAANIGNYTIVLGASDGIDTTQQSFNLRVHDPISVNDDIEPDAIKIYPNPAGSYLNIEINELLEINKYEVIDVYGRKIISQNLYQINTSSHLQIDLEELRTGTYVLMLSGNNKIYSKHFVVCRDLQ